MAVAFDANSEVIGGGTSWTHTPVGTPRGVVVFVIDIGTSDDVSTAVTYGGVPMGAVSGGLAQDFAGEPMSCKAWFLGSGIPTGPQTVAITAVGASALNGVAITVTAGDDTEVVNATHDQGDGTLAEKSISDGGTGVDSLRFAGIGSGLASPPAAGANSTRFFANDDGVLGAAAVRETTAGQGARSVGFSSGSTDDRAAVYLCVREVYTPGAVNPDTGGRAARMRRSKPLMAM